MTTEQALEDLNQAIDTQIRDEDLPYVTDETREALKLIQETGSTYERSGGGKLSGQTIALCIVMGKRISELREAHDNHLHG